VKRAYLILMLASLTACSKQSMQPAARLAPVPPALKAELSAPCPALEELAGKAIAELSQKDFDAVNTYRDCQLRHAGAVNAFEAARAELIEWNTKQENEP
jgi:hypothetical protein